MTRNFVPLGDSLIQVIRAQRALGLVGDVADIGFPGAAGASGRVADAAHRHPGVVDSPLDATLFAFQIHPGVNFVSGGKTLPGGLVLFTNPSSNGEELIFGRLSGLNQPALIQLGDSNAFRGDLQLQPYGGRNVLGNAQFTTDPSNIDGAGVAGFRFAGTTGDAYMHMASVGGGNIGGKWLTWGASFSIADNAFANTLFSLNDAGQVAVHGRAAAYPQLILDNPTAGSGSALAFEDAGTIKGLLGHINAVQLQASHTVAGAIAWQVETTNVFTVNPAASALRGLSVGGFQVIPVIYVQAATPTEVDGALWFQG